MRHKLLPYAVKEGLMWGLTAPLLLIFMVKKVENPFVAMRQVPLAFVWDLVIHLVGEYPEERHDTSILGTAPVCTPLRPATLFAFADEIPITLEIKVRETNILWAKHLLQTSTWCTKKCDLSRPRHCRSGREHSVLCFVLLWNFVEKVHVYCELPCCTGTPRSEESYNFDILL